MGRILLISLLAFLAFFDRSCQLKKPIAEKKAIPEHLQGTVNQKSNTPFDSAEIAPFFATYPELVSYRQAAETIYQKYHFRSIWFDENGVIEFGNSLYSHVKELDREGISAQFPYQEKLSGLFEEDLENHLSTTASDLMLTTLFLFYAEKVYKGIDEESSTAMEWLLPRKEVSYESLLDSTLLNPNLLNHDERILYAQYYQLRNVLQKYREIEKMGGWKPIQMDPKRKSFKPGDRDSAIVQIRSRLFATGDLTGNNQSETYDEELVAAIRKFMLRHGKTPQTTISASLVKLLNVPVGEWIRKIIVNMERCRWISPDIVKSPELVVVNIPSFKMNLIRDGKIEFESPVVVGRNVTKTVIFSGEMRYIVFSPYWVLPKSIIDSEVKPGMARQKDYLEKHNMESFNGQLRQKPGKNNSLGLVKFIFPNSNNIYLHDTPVKSLFERDSRAFSHGCIRVGKPKDLAISILKNDTAWTAEKISKAMNGGQEVWYTLKNKIPVYIGYFTAWVDPEGIIQFYEDIYNRDERLYNVLTQ